MNFTFNKNSMEFSHRHQMVNFSIYSTKKVYAISITLFKNCLYLDKKEQKRFEYIKNDFKPFLDMF